MVLAHPRHGPSGLAASAIGLAVGVLCQLGEPWPRFEGPILRPATVANESRGHRGQGRIIVDTQRSGISEHGIAHFHGSLAKAQNA